MIENTRQPAARLGIFWIESTTMRDLVLILLGSLFVALTAQVAVPLPFSPVPVTGQTLGVLLAGTLLGSRRGALSLLAYLGEGALGLPVFAGGIGGITRLLGPTGGYLLGFVATAYVVGYLCERGWDRHRLTAGGAMLVGNTMIYLVGLPWLAHFIGPEQALPLGLFPFIPGDLLKLVLAALLLPGSWTLVHRIKGE